MVVFDPKFVCGVKHSGKCFCPSRPPRRPRITRDAGHHSRCVQWLYRLPALHRLLAPRFVPVGTSRAGTSNPGSTGCASHTSEVIRFRGSAGCQGRAIGFAGKRMRVIAAPHMRAQGPKEHGPRRAEVHADGAAICTSPRRVTSRSTSFRKATQGVSSVVTVSTASSGDAQRVATLVHCPGSMLGSGRIFRLSDGRRQ